MLAPLRNIKPLTMVFFLCLFCSCVVVNNTYWNNKFKAESPQKELRIQTQGFYRKVSSIECARSFKDYLAFQDNGIVAVSFMLKREDNKIVFPPEDVQFSGIGRYLVDSNKIEIQFFKHIGGFTPHLIVAKLYGNVVNDSTLSFYKECHNFKKNIGEENKWICAECNNGLPSNNEITYIFNKNDSLVLNKKKVESFLKKGF
jgi:hypothetical protein